MVLNEDTLEAEDNTYGNVEYQITEVDKEEFEAEYQNKLTDLGIDSNFVTEIFIYDGSKFTESDDWKECIEVLFVKDDDTLILWKTDMFELKRTASK